MFCKMYVFTAFSVLSCARFAVCDEAADRSKLMGTWGQSGGGESWVIRSAPAGLHITRKEDARVIADFDCSVDGADFVARIDGHKQKVSVYFNGNALVEIEEREGEAVKRSLSPDGSGNVMHIEMTVMTGKVRTEQLEFARTAGPGR